MAEDSRFQPTNDPTEMYYPSAEIWSAYTDSEFYTAYRRCEIDHPSKVVPSRKTTKSEIIGANTDKVQGLGAIDSDSNTDADSELKHNLNSGSNNTSHIPNLKWDSIAPAHEYQGRSRVRPKAKKAQLDQPARIKHKETLMNTSAASLSAGSHESLQVRLKMPTGVTKSVPKARIDPAKVFEGIRRGDEAGRLAEEPQLKHLIEVSSQRVKRYTGSIRSRPSTRIVRTDTRPREAEDSKALVITQEQDKAFDKMVLEGFPLP